MQQLNKSISISHGCDLRLDLRFDLNKSKNWTREIRHINMKGFGADFSAHVIQNSKEGKKRQGK